MNVLKSFSVFFLTLALLLGCLTGCGIQDFAISSPEDSNDSVLSDMDDTTKEEITTTTTTAKSKTTTSIKSTTKKPTTTSRITTTAKTEQQSRMVWIPQSGKKYHSHSSCSGMKNPSQVTLEYAKDAGYTPCKRCYG